MLVSTVSNVYSREIHLNTYTGRTHSPLAGQGANGAMTDGWNLGMESYAVE